jgi:hypothetical protein
MPQKLFQNKREFVNKMVKDFNLSFSNMKEKFFNNIYEMSTVEEYKHLWKNF